MLAETKGSCDKELQDCSPNANQFPIFKMYFEDFWMHTFSKSSDCLHWGKASFLNVTSHECRIEGIQNHWFLSLSFTVYQDLD